MRRALIALVLIVGCQKSDKAAPTDQKTTIGSGGAKSKVEQVTPPFDVKTPPPDAVKTASGLIYKKITTNPSGEAPKRNDIVMINYTGWKPDGETFYTNKSRGQAMPLNLATTAPGFTEGMQLLKTGEKAMLWVPSSIGYKGDDHKGTQETLAYEIEILEIKPAPPVPADVAAAPATAETTKLGSKFVVVRPGTGTAKAKPWDSVTYNYTAWDDTGRMFETTEMKKRPSKISPYRQSAALEEVLTMMTAGERVRVWTTGEKMASNGKPAPGQPTGPVCYEIEVITIEPGVEPPPVPTDVAKPPGDAQKTAKGTYYKVLKAAAKPGAKPKVTDTVKVNYTGWTTDGRMFDSSVIRKEPAEFSLQGVVAGWTDGIPLMSVGDKYRFWIPDELAYKGVPGRPQGMLVFDIELVSIEAPKPVGDHPPPPPGHHHPPPMAPPQHP